MFLSIFSTWYGSKNHIIFNFYSITSKIWELGIGSLIAYFEYFKKKNFSFSQKINEIICFLSLVIIIYFLYFQFSKQAPYNLYNYSYNFGELNNFVVRKNKFF